MNRTKIDWAQYTWNPVTGCLHGCPYCYARNIARRFKDAFPNGFEPTLHESRMSEPAKVKKPSHIFTCSMSDLFGKWIPDDWQQQVFRSMIEASHHTYTTLTKDPKTAVKWIKENNYCASALSYLGTSITGRLDKDELRRIEWLCRLLDINPLARPKAILSLEPYTSLMSPVQLDRNADYMFLHWLIIGGQTGRNPFHTPAEWVTPLVEWAHSYNIPVFVKSNAYYEGAPREFPAGMPHDELPEVSR
jgi:protein gp37